MEGIPVNFGENPEMNNKRKKAKGKLVKMNRDNAEREAYFFTLLGI